MYIESGPILDEESVEVFLEKNEFFDLIVIETAFTRFLFAAMFIVMETWFRTLYWFGVQYPDGQLAFLVNNLYMLSPFLKQATFILYILRFAEALSLHLLIGTEVRQFSSLQMTIYSLMDR